MEKQEYIDLLKSHNWHFETNARWSQHNGNAEWSQEFDKRRRLIEASRDLDPTLEIWNQHASAEFKTNLPCDLQSRQMAWEIFDLLKPDMTGAEKNRVSTLIADGAFLDERDDSNYPLLNLALYFNQTQIAQELVDAGSALNGVSNGGYTPVLSAAFHGKTDVLKMLLDAGASSAGRTGAGHDIFSFAEEKPEVAALLQACEGKTVCSGRRSGLVVQFRGVSKRGLDDANDAGILAKNDGIILRPRTGYRIVS